jgi:hypothetical protein
MEIKNTHREANLQGANLQGDILSLANSLKED